VAHVSILGGSLATNNSIVTTQIKAGKISTSAKEDM